LKASGDINVLSENANQLAIVFASNGDLSLTAGGNISSDTARLLSNDRVFINAGGAFSNGEDVIGAVNGGGPIVKVVKGHRFWWWPWQRSKYENVSFNFGSLRIPDQLAYVDGAEVFINAAGSVTNSGDIFAQSGALEIDAGLFEDFGIVSGSLSFSRYCGFVCKSSGISTAGAASATGDPAGLVSSAGSMQINASSKIVNDGGVILAEGNLGLNSPLITAYGLIAPQIAAFPAGLYNAFAGPTAFLYFQPVGGAFEAPNGAINITTNAPVQVNAGALQAGAGVNNAAGVNLIAPAQPTSNLANEKIGIFHRIW
jgi:adhesin HecA-like repeat protein